MTDTSEKHEKSEPAPSLGRLGRVWRAIKPVSRRDWLLWLAGFALGVIVALGLTWLGGGL